MGPVTSQALATWVARSCTHVDRRGLGRWLADAHASQRTGARHSHGYAACAGQGFFNGYITAQTP